ncbi:MAG: hypothetical protein IBJ10_09610 [Phycisphaerales bacterium]|nr:hypothetical protein [Phycisphaerales bacterium]
MTKMIIAAAALAVAGSAQAAVTGVIWRPVANAPAQGSPNFPGQAGNTIYTFDLILQGDAGQRINGINMGDSAFPNAAPYALYTNGAVANHQLGGNVRSTAFEGFFPDIAFDTFVALGSDAPGPAISFAGGTNLSGVGGVLRATWFTTDNATLDASGEMRIMRVSVGYVSSFDPFAKGSGAFLGTLGIGGLEVGSPESSIQVGLPGGVLTDLVVGNAFQEVPAPGAAALMGLAGLAGLRRRR